MVAGETQSKRRTMQVGISTARHLGVWVLWSFFLSVVAIAPAMATHDGDDEIHVASVPPGSDEIGHDTNLPAVLSAADVERYRQIFALQEDGDLHAAVHFIEALENTVLLGHVQAQKYLHPTAHRSTYMELKLWLDDYADHPQARRIYRLAMRRKPADYKAPRKPIRAARAAVTDDDVIVSSDYVSPRQRTRAQRRDLINLLTHIRKHIRRGELTHAREHMVGPKLNRIADEVEIDIVRAEIAHAFFIWGRDDDALAMAEQSVARSGGLAPLGYWTAGLAAYRQGDLETARRHFEGLALAPRGADSLIAGGAYWAARLNLMTRRPERVSRHLTIAADFSRTFYGLLANRALGQDVVFAWEPPPLTERDVDVVLRIPEVVRTIALAEVGQTGFAEMEMRRLRPETSPALAKAMLALATRIGLPASQLRVATTLATSDGRRHDGGLYPVPVWVPDSGYIVDRAVLFALMRQESAFNERAKSHAGARGLMQLMPRTASFIAGDSRIHKSRREFLYQPEFNIELGQQYVLHLLAAEGIANDLLLTIAAYNGGPGNLRKWLRRTEFRDDPLLFKEALPARETRLFIDHVFTNLWIYRARLGQMAPSLDALAGGVWPAYDPQEPAARSHFANAGN